jgi:hypothetical protein
LVPYWGTLMTHDEEVARPNAVEKPCAPGPEFKHADVLRQHVLKILDRLRQRRQAEQGSITRKREPASEPAPERE